MNEKDARLAALCRARRWDGVLLRRRANIAWVTDGADVHCDTASERGVATVVWTPRAKTVYTDVIEAARLRDEEFDGWRIDACPWWTSPALPKGRFGTDDDVAELRFSLTRDEVKRIRALGRESAEALALSLTRVRRGQTEHEVAADIARELRARGIFPQVLLVAADERVDTYRHPIPTSKVVRKKLMGVVCAQRRGLIVALTRIVHFGVIPRDLRRKHDAVCAVDAALHAATRPGRRWCDLLDVAIRAYRETGFADEWKLHHQGGPMGYEPRDFKATPTETRTVVANQVVGWNPSITGTKSEDTILSDGAVVTADREWPVCGTRPDILRR